MGPTLERTQTVLGFVRLARLELDRATERSIGQSR
jgi:hypothetical protein